MTAHHSRSSSPFSGYLQGLRSRPQAWRTIAAVVGGLLVMLVVLGGLAILAGMAVDRWIGVAPFDPSRPTFTIGFWVAGNLLLALLIPASMLLQKLIYGAAWGTLSSVSGRFRWSVMARAAAVVVPVWGAYAAIIQPVLGTGQPVWSASHLLLGLVAVVTIPLQSAGEEYLFRGLIFRAVGARFVRPVVAFLVATTITAVQFGVIHGSADPWAVAYYIVIGISFAVLAERTGGLEVPVLIHAVNNTLLLVPVILAGELASVSTPSGPILIVPVLLVVTLTLVLWRITPWLQARVPRRTEAMT
ncbi:CPBP family intramembrane glutamic endopeptidase [Microbacterium testaceum]|uniref:CPBP family intramembrane glutamic endopeptidase n=1 Tax=Microbacterium testaceum TaxID=2033 RepID=UPI0009BD257F|nr:type II CAAX endopeptidase family protein [Microbacterium testaceum]